MQNENTTVSVSNLNIRKVSLKETLYILSFPITFFYKNSRLTGEPVVYNFYENN